MKVLLIGAAGTLGASVREALLERGHQVATASRNDPDNKIDISDPASIGDLYTQIGTVDAVASAAGSVPWRPLAELDDRDLLAGLVGKALAQAELVRQGIAHV